MAYRRPVPPADAETPIAFKVGVGCAAFVGVVCVGQRLVAAAGRDGARVAAAPAPSKTRAVDLGSVGTQEQQPEEVRAEAAGEAPERKSRAVDVEEQAKEETQAMTAQEEPKAEAAEEQQAQAAAQTQAKAAEEQPDAAPAEQAPAKAIEEQPEEVAVAKAVEQQSVVVAAADQAKQPDKEIQIVSVEEPADAKAAVAEVWTDLPETPKAYTVGQRAKFLTLITQHEMDLRVQPGDEFLVTAVPGVDDGSPCEICMLCTQGTELDIEQGVALDVRPEWTRPARPSPLGGEGGKYGFDIDRERDTKETGGLRVCFIVPGSPAAISGLLYGDVILALGAEDGVAAPLSLSRVELKAQLDAFAAVDAAGRGPLRITLDRLDRVTGRSQRMELAVPLSAEATAARADSRLGRRRSSIDAWHAVKTRP